MKMNSIMEIETLEELDAPGWGSWVAGIGAGLLVGAIAVAGGIAIT
jgi:hypothetical protein